MLTSFWRETEIQGRGGEEGNFSTTGFELLWVKDEREGREGDGDQRSWRLYVENTNTENGEERMSDEDQREGRRGYLIEISILLAESEVWQDKIKINEFECDCGGRTSGLSERKDALMPQQKNGSGVWW
jgi:hypothetical protein